MIFPLITFPYASRILEADGIGVVNFYSSIISYISLVTCLGIPLYATREIAKVKHDPQQLTKTSTEILLLHIILTLIGYVIVAVLCLTVPRIKENAGLFLILSTSLIFTTMGCDWFFRGTEDFKYITIRGLIVRIIYLPLLFIFVRTKQDLLMYGGLTVLLSVGNNILNFYRLSRLIDLKSLKEASKKPTAHLRGAFNIFLLSASISLYVQVNVIILGFLSSSTNVGYYVAASKITLIFSGVIVALQTSLLPRSSALLAQNNTKVFKETMTKVIRFIFCFTLPMAAGLIVMAPIVIKLIAGDSYEPAIPALKLLSLNLVFSIFNSFICSGILIPQGREKQATYACLIGGVANIALNFLLIPFFLQNGSALAAIITELIVAISLIMFGRNYIPFKIWNVCNFKYLAASIFMFIICSLFWDLDSHEAYRIVVIPLVGGISYIILLNIFKDTFIIDFQKMLVAKFRLVRNR